MGFKNIFNKIIEFVLGSKLSIELDEYKSNFSFMVDILINSLKNDNKSNSTAIDGLVELKDKNQAFCQLAKQAKAGFVYLHIFVSS